MVNTVQKRLCKLSILSVLSGGMGLITALAVSGTASADTHVCIGGYTDPSGAGISAAKAAQGDPCDKAVNWPASVGLPGEPTNVQGSLDVGVPEAVRHYYESGGAQGAPVTIEGSSLGAIAAAQAGDAIKIQNGGVNPPNLTVVTNGNPYGDSGIANDPGIAGGVFHVAAPFVGAPQFVPQDSVDINRNDINDGWGDMANQVPQTQIADIATVQWNHTIPDPRAPHDTYVDPNGTVNEVYAVGENPVSAAAARNGTPVDPAFDAGLDVTFPVNNPADDPFIKAVPPLGQEPAPIGEAFPAGSGALAP
jgi:hypothetical protein